MNSLHLNVKLNFNDLIDAVKKLSPADKMKLNEVLWNENFQIPDEHKKIVTDRITKAKQNPKRVLDWEKASKTLKP